MPNLVGIGLSQVPTNSMLGGMAYQDPDRVKIKKLHVDEISQINSEIADTATDIFIYDTSKDSDGGAWRKRTSHTSWYNETLGTTTRGTRREFPSVAVIVAEVEKLTIYDGDDPNLPMWMVFLSPSTTPYNLIPNVSGDITSITALNGKISLGYHTNYGIGVWDFISEFCINAWRENSRLQYAGTIAERNDQKGTISLGTPYIISYVVNDVAMTVLPNAPIDSATGLPVPTIAVGTDNGVSIIKHDGSVIDYTHQNAAYDVTSFVEFLGDDRVAYGWDNNTTPRRLYITSVRSADTATVDASSYPRDTVDTVGYGRPTDNKDVGNYHGHLLGNDQSVAAGMNGSMLAVGDGSFGLNLIDVQGAGDDTFNSRIAFISKNYNTGWQYGNIKGTFLSDTDTTNVTGSELVTNGTFDTDSDWSKASHWTISGGVATMPSTSEYKPFFQYNLGTTSGTKYVATIDVTAISGTIKFDTASNDGGGISSTDGITITTTGTHTLYFVATPTQDGIGVARYEGSTSSCTIDNITVRIAEVDRSVNDKGLQVFGTVTKSAVATGADLVAYSGFSTNDYLRQPFNSDMEFGTNDYYMSIWAKGGGNDQTLMIREHTGSDDDGSILIFQASGKYNFYSRQGGTTSWTAFSATNATYGDYWSHVMLVRRGGTMYGYVNGKLEGSTSFSGNVSNGDAVITIGKRGSNNTQNYSGSLALAKIGQSAPSAEQIKKIYEDEKMLFQENAKATLYDDGTGIAALAYDETTDQLHVGTSSGRSDFQGLRRINNTTTAVTTAISAHDGFIVEQ